MWQQLVADFLSELLPLLQPAPITISPAFSYIFIINQYILLITYY